DRAPLAGRRADRDADGAEGLRDGPDARRAQVGGRGAGARHRAGRLGPPAAARHPPDGGPMRTATAIHRTGHEEAETTITFNRHLGNAECCTADPVVARRWVKAGWPVTVL